MSSPPHPQKRGTKALELWCRRVTDGYPNVKIENMTTSWRDGLAFCAMIHHFRPDLIDFEKLNKTDVLGNNDLAFRTAEKYLGIPALLEANDMATYEVPDRLSILTYLSQFYKTFGNQDSPSSPDRDKFKFKSSSPSHTDVHDSPRLSPKKFSNSPSPPPLFLRSMSPSSPQATPMKREPCSKCGLPVFLAERILYNNSLYHNSCFKCSRCETQLIPGSLPSNQKCETLSCQACLDKEMGMLLFDEDSDCDDSRTGGGDTDSEYSYEAKFVSGKEHESSETFSSAALMHRQEVVDFMAKPLSDEEKRKSMKGYYEKERSPRHRDDDDDDHLINKSKFDEHDDDDDGGGRSMMEYNRDDDDDDVVVVVDDKSTAHNQSLSLKFATQLLLNVNNDSQVDENNTNNLVENDWKLTRNSSNNNSNINQTLEPRNVELLTQRNVGGDSEPSTPTKNTTSSSMLVVSTSSDPDDNSLMSAKDLAIINRLKIRDNEREIIDKIKMDEEEDVEEIIVVVDEKIGGGDETKTDKDCDQLTCISVTSSNKTNSNGVDDVKEVDESKSDAIELPSFDDDKRANNIPIEDDEVEVDVEDKTNDSLNTEMNKNDNLIKNNKIDCDIDEKLKSFNDDEEEKIVNKEVATDAAENESENTKTSTSMAVEMNLKGKSDNPFESDDDDENNEDKRKGEIEYPEELNPFGDDDDDENEGAKPKPKPRASNNPFEDDEDEENTSESLSELKPVLRTPVPTPRRTLAVQNQSPYGSCNSINSISRHRKGKAPAPPVPSTSAMSSSTSLTVPASPSVSSPSSPKLSAKKKRPAPTPPSNTTPIKSAEISPASSTASIRRVIHMGDSLRDESSSSIVEDNTSMISHRRKVVPFKSVMSDDDETVNNSPYSFPTNQSHQLSERQLEKMKDNKEAKNRNRKSTEFNDFSSMKWRHTKGPAPALPVPISRISMRHELSNQEINHELEVIKVQQNGLEKQGVTLEKMIRSRSEEVNGEAVLKNDRDVEDLIMQLFEIVNEKNELFRRQAELLNLRRQYRLEQEQADLEYKIRLSMAQPERNKTDSDKEREDTLIARLVHVVQQRNEVVECLEMDRLREMEEDMSIKQSIEQHSAKRDTNISNQTLTKLSKKEKKKLFKFASHSKKNKIDADKDEDETEVKTTKSKKHKFIKFSSIIK